LQGQACKESGAPAMHAKCEQNIDAKIKDAHPSPVCSCGSSLLLPAWAIIISMPRFLQHLKANFLSSGPNIAQCEENMTSMTWI